MNIKTGIPFKQAKNYRKGRGRPVQLIIVHSMEATEKGSTAENVASYFAGSNAPMASAHFSVDNNSIVQSVRLEDTAYHCKNANANGIGIEHAGYAKQTRAEWMDEYGQQMLELSAELAASLCHQFNIPVRRAKFAGKNNPQVIETGITGHADVPLHGSHWDPGKGFPWDYYFERVQFHFDGGESQLKALDTPDAIQHAAGSDLVSDSLSAPSIEKVPGRETQFDAPTSQPVADAANPPQQANEAGSVAAQINMQPPAVEPPPVVKSALDNVAEIASTGMGAVGKKLTGATVSAGTGAMIWAFFQTHWQAILLGFALAIFLIGVGIALFAFAYNWQQKKKAQEAAIRSNPQLFNVTFQK
jgi:N-acetyl-anhydromuramyl-L-alanine amidase AmpD